MEKETNSTTQPKVMEEERISRIFDGKKVLITGGTGFIGKVLIEKLLRLCPKISQIIIIVRPKKGKQPKQRVEEMFNNPLFSSLLSSRGMENVISLVTAVTGDVIEKDLGLSKEDRAVCQTANIIIHSAATVRFDVGLKTAVLLNTRGTKYMLELAQQCPKLELFIHVSTAYVHPEEQVLEERIYPSSKNPKQIIEIIENTDDGVIDVLESKLMKGYPNTYVLSKALSESLVEEFMGKIPAVIVRPSVVVPILVEPVKGWTDNINGPTGLLIGAGKGVIRTMYGNDQGFADFIPVDCVVNLLMAMTWDYLENRNEYKVMNLTTSEEIQVTWKEMVDIGREIVETTIPFDNVLWYPGGCITKHRWLHRIRFILYHWIPALFIDAMLYCLGHKPILIRIQTRINKSFEVFEYYTNNQWHFKSDSLRALRQKLNSTEKEMYKMDAEGVDIRNYFEHGTLAARRYILKEPDENLPQAKRHMKMLWYLKTIVTVVFYSYIMYWIARKIAIFLF